MPTQRQRGPDIQLLQTDFRGAMPICAHTQAVGWCCWVLDGLVPTLPKTGSRILDGSPKPLVLQPPICKSVNPSSAAQGNIINHKHKMSPLVRDLFGFSLLFNYKLGIVLV